MAPIGTTVRDASIRVVGHVFQEKLTPSSSSCMLGSNTSAAEGGPGARGGAGAAMTCCVLEDASEGDVIVWVCSQEILKFPIVSTFRHLFRVRLETLKLSTAGIGFCVHKKDIRGKYTKDFYCYHILDSLRACYLLS